MKAEPKLLNGEIVARDKQHIAPAGEAELAAYVASIQMLETKKNNKDGLIGITYRKNYRSYQANLPLQNGRNNLVFRNPLGACEYYNRWVKARYGEHAVTCDWQAVVRKFILKYD